MQGAGADSTTLKNFALVFDSGTAANDLFQRIPDYVHKRVV